ncbi:MAG TPA: AraC family transcriptional regulator [Thermoanaerobaculia bacterium]|nr:AraC family transcriptional regulator [Thermoanaerobaculia bacterium]
MHREFPGFLIRENTYAPGRRMPRHAHDYSNLTIVLTGEIEEITEHGRYHGRSCSVVLKPAGCEHENRVSGAGARTLTIELKDARAIQRWQWFDQLDVVRAAVALRRASYADVEARAWELFAAVEDASMEDRDAPAWIAGVSDVIEQRFDEPLRLEELARDFGLHPVYLSRAFHRHVGVPLNEYLRSLRLRHARHLLATSKRSMIAIASESGFCDSSHFSRTFSGALNITPRTYRRLVQPIQIASPTHS